MYRDIADIMHLLDVLVVVVHISHSNCWITYYCTRIEVSVLRAGRGRGAGGGGGGGSYKKNGGGGRKMYKVFSLLNFFFKNVLLGGDFGGVWGAPRPHPGVAQGRKTILLFL